MTTEELKDEIACDLALGHRVIRRASNLGHAVVWYPLREVMGDVARAVLERLVRAAAPA